MCRLQVVIDARLVVEVVGAFPYVDQVWHDWSRSRWKAGEAPGGAVINGSGYRAWPVPVGACVHCGALEACQHDGGGR